jgi:hypothetical protein
MEITWKRKKICHLLTRIGAGPRNEAMERSGNAGDRQEAFRKNSPQKHHAHR